MSGIDFNSIDINDDAEVIDEQEKTQRPKFFKFIPYLLTALIMLGLGYAIGNKIANVKPTTENVESDSYVVEEINGKITLDERLSAIQNAQLDAIRSQYANVVDKLEQLRPDETNKKYNIALMNKRASELAEPFFKTVLSVKQDAKPSEVKVAEKNVDKYITKSETLRPKLVERMAVNDVARALKVDGGKAGATFMSLIGTDAEGQSTYLTMTPFTSEDTTVNVMHILKIGEDDVITGYEYIGYMNSDDNEHKALYEKLNTLLSQSNTAK